MSSSVSPAWATASRVTSLIRVSDATLGEAISELAQSDLAQKALGPHIFERYVELKRKEWDEYRVQLSEWELKRYLPVL